MTTIRKTTVFDVWFDRLRDQQARARINVRIRRSELGNPGIVAPVGNGVSEMKIDYGPGYRVYFKQAGLDVVLLLCGGDKAMQTKDIERAKRMAEQDV